MLLPGALAAYSHVYVEMVAEEKKSSSSICSGDSPVPSFKLYNLNAISVATLVATWLGGAVLISRNYSKLGDRRAAFISLVIGVLSLVPLGIAVVLVEYPEGYERFLTLAVPLFQIAVIRSISKRFQGEVLSTHGARGGEFYGFWRVIGISVLIAPVAFVIYILFAVLTTIDEVPEDIEIQIIAPKDANVEEPFEIQVHARNVAAIEQTLVDIKISWQYLENIVIDGSDPSFSTSSDVFISTNYVYDLPIPPGQEITITFHAHSVVQGLHSGDFDVCINETYSCRTYRVTTKVGNVVDRRAPDLIVVKDLKVRSHPEIADALIAEVLIVNEAPDPQPFPVLELLGTSPEGDLVAGRRFQPIEYLLGELEGAKEIQPMTPVRIELAFENPGNEAVNYVVDSVDLD